MQEELHKALVVMYLTGLLSTGILALKYAIFWQRKYRPIFLLEKFVLILRGYGFSTRHEKCQTDCW